jgi:hypothetical protein
VNRLSRIDAVVPGLALVLLIAACGPEPVPSVPSTSPTSAAQDACRVIALAYSGTVAGAFSTTVGALRRFDNADADQQRWPNVGEERSAVMCFIDGDIRKALGGGDNAFNRAVVGVVDGRGEIIRAGFQDRLPVRPP